MSFFLPFFGITKQSQISLEAPMYKHCAAWKKIIFGGRANIRSITGAVEFIYNMGLYYI